MFAHARMRPARLGVAGMPSIPGCCRALALGCGVALLTACSAAPPPAPLTGAHPADPGVRVPPASYRSALGDYRSQRPVEPKPWVEQNERVAPAEKP
jgi:hypothetical protein